MKKIIRRPVRYFLNPPKIRSDMGKDTMHVWVEKHGVNQFFHCSGNEVHLNRSRINASLFDALRKESLRRRRALKDGKPYAEIVKETD